MRNALRNSRLKKGLTVNEIVQLLGISASFYYKIEKEKRNPTIELAKKIADVLDETVDKLFCDNLLDDSSNHSDKLNPTGTG